MGSAQVKRGLGDVGYLLLRSAARGEKYGWKEDDLRVFGKHKIQSFLSAPPKQPK